MRQFLLSRLRAFYNEGSEKITENKDLWIQVVEFYNKFTFNITPETIEALLNECSQLHTLLKKIQTNIGYEISLGVTQKTSKLLFKKRRFKDCGTLLTTFLKTKGAKEAKKKAQKSIYGPDQNSKDITHLERLSRACGRAQSVDDLIAEEKNIEIAEKTTNKDETIKEYTGVIGEKEEVSQKDIDAKVKEFERLDLRDQIEKADKYLLLYLDHLSKNPYFQNRKSNFFRGEGLHTGLQIL